MILGMWLVVPPKNAVLNILLSEILCFTSWPLTRRPKFGPTCFPGLLSTFSPSRSLRTLQKILQNFVSSAYVRSWEKRISFTEGNEWDQWLEKNGRSLLYFVRNHFLTLWCWDFLSSLNFQRSTWLIPLCNQTYAWIVSAALLIEIDKIAFVVDVDSAPSIFSNIVGTLLIEFDLIEFEADVAPCIFGHLMVYWHLSAPLPSPRAERRSLAWK